MKFYSVDRKLNRFNDFVRGELKRKKISQEDIVYRIGIERSGVSRRLSGQIDWTIREVIILSEVLEVPIGEMQ